MKKPMYIVLACLVATSVLFFCIDHPLLAVQEQSPSVSPQQKLIEIEEEIKSLEDARDKYLSAAARAEDQGMRWQFMQNEKQEAKRAFERADTNKQAAAMLQDRIDVLHKMRAQLLQSQPGGQ